MHSVLDFLLLTVFILVILLLHSHFICINHKPFEDVKIIIYVLKDVLRLFSMFTELIQEQFASFSAITEFKTAP